jgi:hypothetical protein
MNVAEPCVPPYLLKKYLACVPAKANVGNETWLCKPRHEILLIIAVILMLGLSSGLATGQKILVPFTQRSGLKHGLGAQVTAPSQLLD